MKKTLTKILVALTALSMVACGGNTNPGKPSDPSEPSEPSQPSDPSSPQQPEKKKYTVSFSGITKSSVTLEEGSKFPKPEEPTKEGSIFGGWFLDGSYSTEASFPITVTKDVTLYARFYSYSEAFIAARKATIGDDVAGYEFDHETSVTGAYKALALQGKTVGNSKYNKSSNISFYDVSTNSGALFYDGTNYQIKEGTNLKKISVDENDKLMSYSVEDVGSSYKFDSSSFSKAIFEFKDSDLKSIEKTETKNVYRITTGFTASKGIALVGNFVNNPIVEKVIGSLPETSVRTDMFVTFADGRISKYAYAIIIDVSTIKFQLSYTLSFKNPGKVPTISPRTFNGVAITSSEVNSIKSTISNAINSYKSQEHSGYDIEIKTELDYGLDALGINSTFAGTALRKVTNANKYFHNEIEVDSDLKNADLYKAAGIDDVKTKKSRLSNGDVYHFKKGLLFYDDGTKLTGYTPTDNDYYYMLLPFGSLSGISFIEKTTSSKGDEYRIGLSNSDVTYLLNWLNNNLDLDPMKTATKTAHVFGEFDASTLKPSKTKLVITIKEGKLVGITIDAKGKVNTKFTGSRDFTNMDVATYSFEYKLTPNSKGDSYEPYESASKAK